jgi:hypothetical protein
MFVHSETLLKEHLYTSHLLSENVSHAEKRSQVILDILLLMHVIRRFQGTHDDHDGDWLNLISDRSNEDEYAFPF